MKLEKVARKKGLTDAGKKWAAGVEYRRRNSLWLDYSRNIAVRVLSAIKDNADMNQKILAQIMGVTPQQVSKIVKGQENLTLESIAKLSQALKVDLISFPGYKYSISKVN